MLFRKQLALGLVFMSLLPLGAMAGTDSGFYVGAGIGRASVGDIDTDDPNLQGRW